MEAALKTVSVRGLPVRSMPPRAGCGEVAGCTRFVRGGRVHECAWGGQGRVLEVCVGVRVHEVLMRQGA